MSSDREITLAADRARIVSDAVCEIGELMSLQTLAVAFELEGRALRGIAMRCEELVSIALSAMDTVSFSRLGAIDEMRLRLLGAIDAKRVGDAELLAKKGGAV